MPYLDLLLPALVLACGLLAVFMRHRRLRRQVLQRTLAMRQQSSTLASYQSLKLLLQTWSRKLGVSIWPVVLAGAGSIVLGVWFNLPIWCLPVLATAACWLTVLLYRRILLQRARTQFASDFPAAVDHLTRAIQAGVPLERALVSIGDTFDQDLGKRFRRLARELEIGLQFREALDNLAGDLDMPDVSFFCAALALNRDSGGALAHILAMLSKTLQDRRRAALKLRTLTAESRAAARIVGTLPVIILALQAWLNPRQFQFLLNDPTGQTVLTIAAICIVSGLLVIWRMSRL